MPVNNTRNVLTEAPGGTIARLMRMERKFVRPRLDPPCPYILPNQMVGVELEYENARAMSRRVLDHTRSSGYWSVTTDGSLRDGGEEFVLREGLEGLELAYAIHEFFTLAEGTGLRESGRTSCHVHLDMRDAHIELLRATVLVYQAVEKMFWGMVHRQRRWTGYCIPLVEAQGHLVSLLFANNAVNSANHIISTANHISRYSGLNVAAITRHGTIEFRHFHNPADEEQMNRWINVCMAVRQAGEELIRRCEGASVVQTVNGNPQLVVDVVTSNTTLMEAAVSAGLGAAEMLLEVERLLAVTESLNPTGPVNTLGASVTLSPDVRSVLFGSATGIGGTNTGRNFSRLVRSNMATLTNQLSMHLISTGMSGGTATNTASIIASYLQDECWPSAVMYPNSHARAREWLRNVRLTGIQAQAIISHVFELWEAGYNIDLIRDGADPIGEGLISHPEITRVVERFGEVAEVHPAEEDPYPEDYDPEYGQAESLPAAPAPAPARSFRINAGESLSYDSIVAQADAQLESDQRARSNDLFRRYLNEVSERNAAYRRATNPTTEVAIASSSSAPSTATLPRGSGYWTGIQDDMIRTMTTPSGETEEGNW